ncbi:PREDICTED: P2X purinoceptor 3 [Corvus brachyrhynchos]|uniref:P2X purinoceptor 3 n=1 Tax=Corvus brachyrhynchos TaxID=85066 RepID=UPI0008164E8A|nr:PREDICTED: P2X purinoceptor 3 [Corvus brachyrhynchos]
MLEAENFTLLIKNSIRFPLFGFEKTNLPPPGSGVELGRCRFHPQLQPLCPILRLGDVARLAGQDFPALAATVSGDAGGTGDTVGERGVCGDIQVRAGGM